MRMKPVRASGSVSRMVKGTIVLEGGANRGVFTSGALDYLMERDLYLSDVIGVSAGACNGVDYVSRQPGRTRDCMIQKDREYSYYSSAKRAVKNRSVIDMDMLFDRYPNELIPFDYDTYFASEMKCEITVTNCLTGRAEYMTEGRDRDRLMDILRASSSMPLLSPMVRINGTPYLDGGIADSIPIGHALEKGNEKIVVILTRNPGYRKKMPAQRTADICRRIYRRYPKLARAMIRRNYEYNQAAARVKRLEEKGKIFVLRPLIPTVSRLEKNYDSLMNFYEHGYKLMEERYEELCIYMNTASPQTERSRC